MSEHPTNPNNSPPLRTVWSPLGEKFEVSPANFYDLTRNAKWTEQKPHPDTVREYCESNGIDLPADFGSEEPAPAPAPAPAAETPAAPAETETKTEETADAAGEQTTSGEAPEEVVEQDEQSGDDNSDDDNSGSEGAENDAVKTEPNHFADMDKDAVRDYISTTFPGTEIDGRKGRDALVAQALELAAARAA
jgi:hypothetical protein